MYPGTKFAMDWVKKHMYTWQAQLKRISHYLLKERVFSGILLNQVMFVLMMVEMILNLSKMVHVCCISVHLS